MITVILNAMLYITFHGPSITWYLRMEMTSVCFASMHINISQFPLKVVSFNGPIMLSPFLYDFSVSWFDPVHGVISFKRRNKPIFSEKWRVSVMIRSIYNYIQSSNYPLFGPISNNTSTVQWLTGNPFCFNPIPKPMIYVTKYTS